MKTAKLLRLEMNVEHGTFGVLLINEEFFCLTLELPDKENQKGISSIPYGKYLCAPYSSNRYAGVYEVTRVLDRTNILFHVGNTVKDTRGCILLGEGQGFIGGYRAIINSRKTFERFKKTIGKEKFLLKIKELYWAT